jgi:inner membrane protein
MKFPLLSKLVALGAVIVALLISLNAVHGLVNERRSRQLEAEQSVADSLAGQQTVLGPVLQQRCEEVWTRTEGTGKDQKTLTERRDLLATAWPSKLAVDASATIEPRYRGLFKLNGYVAKNTIVADWAVLAPPRPGADHPDARVVCQVPTIAVALSDARGIRAAVVRVGGQSLDVLPGSLLKSASRGLHAEVPAGVADAAFRSEITLDLAGTKSLAWAPVGEQTTLNLASDWAHPSFGGRFLPTDRQVTPQGFTARWQVSALATTARHAAQNDATLCEIREAHDGSAYGTEVAANDAKRGCIETFGVGFIDPVNGYVLNDRAVKYGILFVVLTFVGVGLVELTKRLRVHPVQYLLVGFALTVFFLLLLSLSEQVSFSLAYLCASTACTGLLTFYGSFVLRGVKPGLVLGAGIGLLYGALYALLQMEQAALVLGSVLLFVVLAAVMIATRRIDWYAMAAQLRDDALPAQHGAGTATRAAPVSAKPAPGTAS